MSLRLAALAAFLSAFPSCAFAEQVRWPPKGAAELVGRVGCDFPQEAGIGFYSVPVLGNEAYRLDYRKNGEEQQYILLTKKRSAKGCDAVVVAALRLPRYRKKTKVDGEIRDRFVIELMCRYLGVEWTDNDAAFGIVDQQLPSGYFMPRKAWRVDVSAQKFIQVDRELVTCARFSVHDNRSDIKR